MRRFEICLLIRHLVGNSKITEISKINKVTPFKIRNWLRKKSPPDLETILSIIDNHTHVLVLFISQFADVSRISEMKAEFSKREAEIRLMRHHPVSGAVLRVLELEEYQKLSAHKPGWISEKLGINLDEEIAIIEGLQQAQLISKKSSKYQVLSVSFDPQGDFHSYTSLRLYWLDRTQKFLKGMNRHPKRDMALGQLVFSCSNEAKKKIIDKYTQFFYEIRTVIANDPLPPEQVNVLGVQLLDISKIQK